MPRKWTEVVIGTLVHGGVEVLLGTKDPQRSWAQYNSPLRHVFYGGKRNPGESPEHAFMREFQEESGLSAHADSVEKVAVILLHKRLPNGGWKHLRMHVFLASAATGILHYTDEMKGWRWVNQRALPKYAMLAADQSWMPLIFAGEKLIVSAFVDNNQRDLLRPVLIRKVRCSKKISRNSIGACL